MDVWIHVDPFRSVLAAIRSMFVQCRCVLAPRRSMLVPLMLAPWCNRAYHVALCWHRVDIALAS